MLQLGARVPEAEQTIRQVVREVLSAQRFEAVAADDVRRTSDFLHKIVDLIRGCGFGVAIFSDRTPAKTLANIFFEIGVAAMLGKLVQLIWHGRNPRGSAAPSDFVRTEWIRYIAGDEVRLRRDFGDAVLQMGEAAAYYRKIGDVAFEAPDPDLELAFERYKQAILISDDAGARQRLTQLRERLAAASRRPRAAIGDDLAGHRTRLLRAVDEFMALLPPTS